MCKKKAKLEEEKQIFKIDFLESICFTLIIPWQDQCHYRPVLCSQPSQPLHCIPTSETHSCSRAIALHLAKPRKIIHYIENKRRRKWYPRIGRPKNSENLEDLIDFAVAGKVRGPAGHFCDDAAQTPDVQGGRVAASAQQNLQRKYGQTLEISNRAVNRMKLDSAFSKEKRSISSFCASIKSTISFHVVNREIRDFSSLNNKRGEFESEILLQENGTREWQLRVCKVDSECQSFCNWRVSHKPSKIIMYRARPKSANFMIPFFFTSMFWGFRSRWITWIGKCLLFRFKKTLPFEYGNRPEPVAADAWSSARRERDYRILAMWRLYVTRDMIEQSSFFSFWQKSLCREFSKDQSFQKIYKELYNEPEHGLRRAVYWESNRVGLWDRGRWTRTPGTSSGLKFSLSQKSLNPYSSPSLQDSKYGKDKFSRNPHLHRWHRRVWRYCCDRDPWAEWSRECTCWALPPNLCNSIITSIRSIPPSNLLREIFLSATASPVFLCTAL